ncbi:recombinase family protein [Paludibaculum fermentans]|uniref:Recombinase family protein n=1 Tax=Paludibaculum fermentans TaxID=1473598 RepID=A0A7S7SK97_PALFE|nr:recombinase family protein [Paludibaculum fermentans]QOY86800.1 recombinase family protein [Paludibaculum fermentans]QOY87514.1 recombinase family protein [Paludibaculum fermentans]QOY90561.1 recombinase family protein [Paludibaculum fermentans]
MSKITADHLARRACIYIRQSTPDQVRHNLESQRLQYSLADRARGLGWQDVDVIDEDLGISGAGTRRPGFERLLRALCNGQVGAVFSVEASRLARNGRDWHTLLEFCSIVGALLIDADTTYDPRLTNDRLLLGMKGTISEMEIATFRERAQSALRQKAERGALVRRVPIGYVKGTDDQIEKDPDVRIASTVELIFRKFTELGSARQVFFWLDRNQIQMPVARGPETSREVVWQPARYHAVHSILKNPVYAGAYTYGQSKTTVRLEDGQKRVCRSKQPRQEDWAVLITEHHEGYIDWDAYRSNQAVIADNENAKSASVRGSVRQGGAILAGLLRCGHCGAKLLAQSPRPGVIRYQCSGYVLNRDHPCCVMFGGLRADRLVSEQLLGCLAPLGTEAAIEAMESLQGGSDERVRQKALALEQARYDVTRARRQYDAVDPANRLVAAELERRWNLALAEEARVEAELAALQQRRESPLTDEQKRKLLDFARDLPSLWDDALTSPEHKKRLLRIALKEIVVTSEGETIRFVLHWQGGDHTQTEFSKIRAGRHRYVTDDEVVETVRALARIEPDARIAALLNRNRKPTAHGKTWTARHVCSLRCNHKIEVYREGERQSRGEVSVSETADILGVTQTTVLRLIRLKRLKATQICPNAPWILRRVDVEQWVADRNEPTTPPTETSGQMSLEIP